MHRLFHYLSKGSVHVDKAKDMRLFKMKAKNELLYERELCRRTTYGLRFVPIVDERSLLVVNNFKNNVDYFVKTDCLLIAADMPGTAVTGRNGSTILHPAERNCQFS